MLMKTGILYFTTCFHGFDILRFVDPFVRMLHIYAYVEDYHTCSGVFNKPVNASMDNAGIFEKWHL